MAEVEITHVFVTGKAESPDPTIVSAHEWNDRLNIGGGANTQMIVRDTSQVHGAKWINGPAAYSNTGSYSGGNLSAGLAPITVAKATSCALLLCVSTAISVASGTTAVVSWYKNGVQTRIITVTADGLTRVNISEVIQEAAGTDSYSVILSTAGPNITASTVGQSLLVLGLF